MVWLILLFSSLFAATEAEFISLPAQENLINSTYNLLKNGYRLSFQSDRLITLKLIDRETDDFWQVRGKCFIICLYRLIHKAINQWPALDDYARHASIYLNADCFGEIQNQEGHILNISASGQNLYLVYGESPEDFLSALQQILISCGYVKDNATNLPVDPYYPAWR